MPNVAINGFGRIGRAVFKILADSSDVRVVAVNDLAPIENLAYLLKYDTVYGRYGKRVSAEKDALLVDGARYPFYSEADPARLPWRQAGVNLVFECTGVFNKRHQLEPHLKAGAQHVLLSAPGKDEEIVTVVHGVNRPPDGHDQIVSCASCTTNCITPVIEILGRRIGLRKAVMTTVARLHRHPIGRRRAEEEDPQRARGGGESHSGDDRGGGRHDEGLASIPRKVRRRGGACAGAGRFPRGYRVGYGQADDCRGSEWGLEGRIGERALSGYCRGHRRPRCFIRHHSRTLCRHRRSGTYAGHRRRPCESHVLVRQRVGLCQPDGA